jgi:hypothetical protein
MMKRLLISLMFLCSVLLSQASGQTDSLSTITVLTDPSGADLYVDSMFVGKSPLHGFSVQRGIHHVKAFYPSVFSWNAVEAADTIEVGGTAPVEKRLSLGKILKVQTDPPGSTVLFGGTPLGVTPLYVRGDSSIAGNLVIQKSGYDSVRVSSNEIKEGFLRLHLRPITDSGAVLSPGDVRGPDFVATDRWPTYVTGFAMIVSGVTSAYLKDQANRKFDDYLLTKNPASLSDTHRLDRGAAITFVISQISFVVLSYLLLSE